ncbi:GTP-binding protein Era [Frankineae bacterium MT45]|nr:GTP-binding protein Era [Frankineae bacterium MT45]
MSSFRSGFCCFVGRPNAGKSTLTNALVGSKIVITSDKPQTTRHAVRGIVNRPHAQLIVVDTPGLHRPRTLLGQRLNDVVHDTLADVDVIGFCLPANEKIGPGDRYIAAELAKLNKTVIAIVTKTDAAKKAEVGAQLLAVSQLGDFAEIVPVSAVSGAQVELLADLFAARMPEGPALYPNDVLTDSEDEDRMAELIREAALDGVFDELPHSIAVTIEEMRPRANNPDITEIFATIHLERDSQKGIMIGHKGARLKQIGITSRQGIEELIGGKVHLDLHISVMAEWQRDPKKLDRLGF